MQPPPLSLFQVDENKSITPACVSAAEERIAEQGSERIRRRKSGLDDWVNITYSNLPTLAPNTLVSCFYGMEKEKNRNFLIIKLK